MQLSKRELHMNAPSDARSGRGAGDGEDGQDSRGRGERPLRRQAGAQGRCRRYSRQGRDGLHRPLGLRQDDVPALHQPDERRHSDRQGHRHDPDRRPGHPRPQDRCRRAAGPRRHGVPEAQSVPQVHLRERGLRTAHPRLGQVQGRVRGNRRFQPQARRSFRGSQGPAARSGNRPLRRPAAAAVHCPRHCRRARKSSSWTSPARPSTRSPPRASRS